jgi:hypothetical protein
MAGQSAGKASATIVNNQSGGRSGSKMPVKSGPAAGGGIRKNPTKGGGINRATQK